MSAFSHLVGQGLGDPSPVAYKGRPADLRPMEKDWDRSSPILMDFRVMLLPEGSKWGFQGWRWRPHPVGLILLNSYGQSSPPFPAFVFVRRMSTMVLFLCSRHAGEAIRPCSFYVSSGVVHDPGYRRYWGISMHGLRGKAGFHRRRVPFMTQPWLPVADHAGNGVTMLLRARVMASHPACGTGQAATGVGGNGAAAEGGQLCRNIP